MADPITAFLISVGVGAGTAAVVGGIVARLAFAAIVSSVVSGGAVRKTSKTPKAPDLNRELQKPSNQPPKRFAYGTTSVYGSFAPLRVKGEKLFGCMILNSRPSHGNFTMRIDKREVTLTGDPYDFAGAGASATNEPFNGYLRVWFGLGDQTTPPSAVTAEAPEFFETTDGWQGQTVAWMILDAGPNENRQSRWPRVPPEIEVEGDYSLVYDPRDTAQSLSDPSTWQFSDNQALCLLDALTQNPVEPYRENNIQMATFEQAADIADEAVALKAGGTEPRYRVGGLIRFDETEIEDQVEPLVAAGGGDLTRIAGRLGYVAGAYSTPVYTLTDFLDDEFEFTRLIRGRDLPTQIRTSYVSPARLYDEAELEPWDIPGAQAEDGGVPKVRDLRLPMVQSATQAMRLRKIFGMNARLQKHIIGVAPPDAFECIGGSGVTVALPSPYTAMNGDFKVQAINPAFDYLGESGVAMRCLITLKQNSSAPYQWDGATEEEDVLEEPFDADRDTVQAPGAVILEPDPFTSDGSVVPRFRVHFSPSISSSVREYNVQFRTDGGEWIALGVADAATVDGQGDVFSYINSIDTTKAYQARVQSISEYGRSSWRESQSTNYNFALSGVAASAAPGRAEFSGTAPDTTALEGVRVMRAETSDFGSSVPVGNIISVSPGVAFSVAAGDLSATNLIRNGRFFFDTAWSKGAGWSISSGAAHHAAGTAGDISQGASLTAASVYRIACKITGRTAGSLTPELQGGTSQTGAAMVANVAHFQKIAAVAGNNTVAFAGTSDFDGSLDAVNVVEETETCVEQGPAYFWILPVTNTGQSGAAVGPFLLNIP